MPLFVQGNVFVRFESVSPTVFKGKRDRVLSFLSSGEPSELTTFCFELVYVTSGWLFAHSPAGEVPILHMLLQRSCSSIVSH